jgi:hypothetical protein
MASQSRSDAARATGSKSRGPVTGEGKARSSQNAHKHGLCASFDAALPDDSQEDFDQLLESHEALFRPVNGVECELVRTLAIARWRLRRIPALETAVFNNNIVLAEEIDGIGRLGFVFQELADRSQVLQLLIRYEGSLTRVYDRTFKHLAALQKLRNEPNERGAGTPASRLETPLEARAGGVEDALCTSWAPLRADAWAAGRSLSPQDAWIVATAPGLDAPLATNNRSGFEHAHAVTGRGWHPLASKEMDLELHLGFCTGSRRDRSLRSRL